MTILLLDDNGKPLPIVPAQSVALTIAQSAALSGAFDMSKHIGGQVIVPSEWTDANIGFKISNSQTGTFVIACKEDGSPIQVSGVTTNASKSYKIPNELFPAMWVKLWSKSTTAATITDTNQDAARSLTVVLK